VKKAFAIQHSSDDVINHESFYDVIEHFFGDDKKKIAKLDQLKSFGFRGL